MSTGRLVGGILGAALGYVVGGGALMPVMYGLSLGWTVGAMFDKPDSKPPGRPPVAELSVTSAREGALIYDLLGTHKFTGNIIGYWNSRSVEVTSEVQTGGKGGGGSQTVVEGYEYYLTWAMGICLGPVDTLYTVWRGEECVWDGELSRPSSGGESTITLCGMGSMTLYWGTSDHAANATIAGLVSDNTINPPYRHLCWAFFNDCMIGDYNRLPVMHFVVRKSPTLDFNTNSVIETYDYNPAHAIYYILNRMVGMNSNYLDSTSFSSCAESLYLESKGVSILFDTNQEALEYIQSILSHIDAVLRWDTDSKMHLKLLRADTASADLPLVNQDDLLEKLTMRRKSWIPITNEVKIQFYERIYMKTCCGEEDACSDSPVLSLVSCNSDGEGVYSITGGCPPFYLYKRVGEGDSVKLFKVERTFAYDCSYSVCSDALNRYIKIVDVNDSQSNEVDISMSLGGTLACDTTITPSTIDPGDSGIAIAVTGGTAPYSWSSDSIGYTLGSPTTVDKNNTISCSSGNCGEDYDPIAVITITDACDNTCTCTIRCTGGDWVQRGEVGHTGGVSYMYAPGSGCPGAGVPCNSGWDHYYNFDHIYTDNGQAYRIYASGYNICTYTTPMSCSPLCKFYATPIDWKLYTGGWPNMGDYWVSPGDFCTIVQANAVSEAGLCKDIVDSSCDISATAYWFPGANYYAEFYRWECI